MQEAEPRPVRESLAAAARELERIVRLGRELEDGLSPLLRTADAPLAALQGLDQLVQQAQGLSQFLDALGSQCPDGWRVSGVGAAAALGLAAQRRRLAEAGGTATDGDEASSELELF